MYGLLIYKQLGDGAEQEFARSWGLSYGMDVRSAAALAARARCVVSVLTHARSQLFHAAHQAATEWQDIVKEAVKGAVVLAILERLQLTSNSNWVEELIDYYSINAVLFRRTATGLLGQLRLFFRFTRRVAD